MPKARSGIGSSWCSTEELSNLRRACFLDHTSIALTLARCVRTDRFGGLACKQTASFSEQQAPQILAALLGLNGSRCAMWAFS